jgi:hypothetical protein
MIRSIHARRGPRIMVALGLLLALGGLFGALAVQTVSAVEADTRFVAAERQGVALLRPLTRLISELTAAQSASVRGKTVDAGAINGAAAAVSEVEASSGTALRTRQRWTDLNAAIKQVVADRPTGEAALGRFTDLITLATELARTVGDTSNLILDPEFDSYYLVDAALFQLPIVMTGAGRVADYAYLEAAQVGRAKDGTSREDMALARQQVAAATESVGSGLRKAIDATAHEKLASGLTEQLDAFRAAADQLASPVALRQPDGPANAVALSAAAQRVQEASLTLEGAVLDGLDAVLARRDAALHKQRLYALATASAGVVIGIVLLWWSVPPRRVPDGDPAKTDRDDRANQPDVAPVSVQLPAVDARDLLDIEELVHVGRGVRARPKGEASDAR